MLHKLPSYVHTSASADALTPRAQWHTESSSARGPITDQPTTDYSTIRVTGEYPLRPRASHLATQHHPLQPVYTGDEQRRAGSRRSIAGCASTTCTVRKHMARLDFQSSGRILIRHSVVHASCSRRRSSMQVVGVRNPVLQVALLTFSRHRHGDRLHRLHSIAARCKLAPS